MALTTGRAEPATGSRSAFRPVPLHTPDLPWKSRLGHFKKGRAEYDMFLAKLDTPTDAAILLLSWSKALTNAKLVPSFGGYFGQDAGRPVFVFSKGAWITGIAGLPQKEADTEARVLASRIE